MTFTFAKMKLSYLITVLFWIKTTLAGIEIPRDGCDWLSGTSYGIDIKCDGNFIFSIIQNTDFVVKSGEHPNISGISSANLIITNLECKFFFICSQLRKKKDSLVKCFFGPIGIFISIKEKRRQGMR